MIHPFRITLKDTVKDPKGKTYTLKAKKNQYLIDSVQTAECYVVNKNFDQEIKTSIGKMLTNPVFESAALDHSNAPENFDFSVEIGFRPGVTDNLGATVREAIEDLTKDEFDFPTENVFSSTILFITGKVNSDQAKEIGLLFANPLIQRISVKSYDQFQSDQGMDVIVPKVELDTNPSVDQVDLEVSDEALKVLGKKGIQNSDGSYRGPLALSVRQLHEIREHFRALSRNPFDIELESIAQTWSEHCKHTIFANAIDEISDGLYKGLIKKATNDIRANKGDDDFCVSVFKDNSGGIIFDENYVVTDKAETHNSPSALDPFGGAITGIVGVNRDCLGYGLGAKPSINRYGFCCGIPQEKFDLYRQKDQENPIIQPRDILDGVVGGVNSGGNESGIPCPQGFVYFDKRYSGKPLVFAGTVGIIPKEINGNDSSEKKANPGDLAVVAGGRVGLDGVHGATFSSEALDSGSPATAVQIGDPITQKKMSDAIIREARELYTAVTDNGAGGISCSIPEMAESSDCGCRVDLDKVPLKYPNLSPWEIWISESQERMTFSVPPENVDKIIQLFADRGVEAVVVGEFTDDGQCRVDFHGDTIMDIDIEFMQDGWPREHLKTSPLSKSLSQGERDLKDEKKLFEEPSDYDLALNEMLARPNICSYEFISKQYDHNVQSSSVTKPLQGPGRVNTSAVVSKPILESTKGVVTSQGINPRYSDIDCYHMAACSIDDAVAAAVATGANVDYLAIMDNFCWCSSDDSARLGQLKKAVQACYDVAVKYGTPYISGKDSMYNDFKGFDRDNNPVHVAIPPTLLVSGLGVIPDITKAVTLDFKIPGDLIYIIGETRAELGGSEYFDHNNKIGVSVPNVDTDVALDRYRRIFQANQDRLLASSIHVDRGGIGVAIAKSVIAGQIGAGIEIKHEGRLDFYLFSESQSRFIVSINPENKEVFEKLFSDSTLIGSVTEDDKLSIKANNEQVISSTIKDITDSYKVTFKDF